MDFFKQQDQARKKTKWLVLYFALAVIAIIVAINAVSFVLMNSVGGVHFSVAEWLRSSWFWGIALLTLLVIVLAVACV